MAGMGTTWDESEEDKTPYCHVQGFCPRVFHMDGNQKSDGICLEARRTLRNGVDPTNITELGTPAPPPTNPKAVPRVLTNAPLPKKIY